MKAILALLAMLALAGCAGGRADVPVNPLRPGLRWEHFPDLPMPAGWQTLPDEEHVALAIGNGAVRRLRVTFVAPASRSEMQPPEAIARYVGHVLPDSGWTRDGEGRPDDLRQTWRKGDETLDVRATREGGLAVLRYALRAPPAR